MIISKTTFNMAKNRNLELTVECLGQDNDRHKAVCIWEADNDCEWLCSYRLNDEYLSWGGNVCLPVQIKEELPATIKNERELRAVISFIATSLFFFRGKHDQHKAA